MISVCMATYNGEHYIKEQISSILSQLGKEDEVVVSDDNSTDKTVSILREYGDKRIRLIINANHSYGASKHQLITRNFFNAIKHSSGDIIFLSDQDDMWLPMKVKTCLKALENCDLVIHNAEKCSRDMNSLDETMWADTFRFHNYFMLPHSYMGCCMAFRRTMLNQILPPPTR